MEDHQARCRTVYSQARDVGLSENTAAALADFALAMADKLRAAELKHGWQDDWRDPANVPFLQAELVRHIAKGDPVDVANFCMFLSAIGERSAP